MIADGPDAVRARVRDWLTDLLAAERACVTLDDPADWSSWDERQRR
jgi:SRSO17 transposase